jgi:hypothetical protein
MTAINRRPLRSGSDVFAQVRFVFDGNRLNPGSSPADEGMEDGDTIDAFLEQIGGSGGCWQSSR